LGRQPLLSLVVWAVLAAAFAPCAGAQTPLPFDELGAGPRATAMGQAFAAVADDASAAYYSPAGLSQIRSPIHLTMGYQYAKPRVHVDFRVPPAVNPYLGRATYGQVEDLSTRGFYFGYACNFADVSAFKDSAVSSRLSVGIALFTNLPEVNQFENPQRPQDPYVFKYNERWSLVSLAISMGVRCTDWLSVGGGLLPRIDGLQSSTGSWITVNGILDPEDPSKGLRMNLEQTTRIMVVPIGGVLFRLPVDGVRDLLSFGVTYRGKMWGYYGTGPTAVDILIQRPGQDPIVLFQDPGGRTVDYIGFTPEQVTGGVAARPFPGFTAAFDLTWKRYSQFHFFWDLPPFDLVDGRRVDIPFQDVWVPRVGLAYAFDPGFGWKFTRRFDEISLLAGYYREESPVPNMDGPMNILDADQNVVSTGFGVSYDATWTGHVKLEAFFQAHLLDENTIANNRDELFGPITVGGQVYNAGVALSVVY